MRSGEYIAENVVRHLAQGGLLKELGELLTDYRWLMFRVDEQRLLQMESDIELGANAGSLSKGSCCNEDWSTRLQGLLILRKAFDWRGLH